MEEVSARDAARARLRGSLRSHATPRQHAAASYPQWHGTPAIVFGVPTRYIHSHNGILDDRDLDACVDLTCALVQSVTKEFLDHLMD